MKVIRAVLSAFLTMSLVGNVCFAKNVDNQEQYIMDSIWGSMTEEQRFNSDLKYKANAVRLSEEEFIFFARVIEAESDGKGWEGYTNKGRIAIAACIWDRVYSGDFPNTVTGVLTQSGQFTTVSNGWCSKNSTSASEWAIIKGREAVINGDLPNNLNWFNCINFCHTPYDVIGDNYFSTTGQATYFEEGEFYG